MNSIVGLKLYIYITIKHWTKYWLYYFILILNTLICFCNLRLYMLQYVKWVNIFWTKIMVIIFLGLHIRIIFFFFLIFIRQKCWLVNLWVRVRVCLESPLRYCCFRCFLSCHYFLLCLLRYNISSLFLLNECGQTFIGFSRIIIVLLLRVLRHLISLRDFFLNFSISQCHYR